MGFEEDEEKKIMVVLFFVWDGRSWSEMEKEGRGKMVSWWQMITSAGSFK